MTEITKITFSEHLLKDRMDRMVKIATTIGFGVIIEEFRATDKYYCLTDTGVILIKSLDRAKVITAFPAHLDRIYALYKSVDKFPPKNIIRIIRNNEIKRKFLYEI